MAASSRADKLELVSQHIRSINDFPKKGILFWDICPILKEPKALAAVIDLFEEHVKQNYPQTHLIVGLDARGFLFGPLLAQRLGIGFVLVRKKGKLPGPTVSVEYTLEYGMIPMDHHLSSCRTRDIILAYDYSRLICNDLQKTIVKAEAEIQADAVEAGQKVLIIDDLLATGGTLHAACELLKKQKADVQACMVVIELKDLHGAERLSIPMHSLLQL